MSAAPTTVPHLKFVRELPPLDRSTNRPYGYWQEVLAELSKRRGRWAQVGAAKDYRNLFGTIDRAKKNGEGSFEIAVRGGNVFARRTARGRR